jgi:hypothetical protein
MIALGNLAGEIAVYAIGAVLMAGVVGALLAGAAGVLYGAGVVLVETARGCGRLLSRGFKRLLRRT